MTRRLDPTGVTVGLDWTWTQPTPTRKENTNISGPRQIGKNLAKMVKQRGQRCQLVPVRFNREWQYRTVELFIVVGNRYWIILSLQRCYHGVMLDCYAVLLIRNHALILTVDRLDSDLNR
jgi:hypothetical protein